MIRVIRTAVGFLTCAFSYVLAQSPAWEHHHLSVSSSPVRPGPGLAIPDFELLNQDGRKVHFYQDLVKGRTVAINFIFTTCTTICLPMGANFAKLERLLGTRAGHEINLISVSIDPGTDTPARLKEWAAKFHGGPGWTLVTGSKADIDKLLKALGVFTPDKVDHSSLALIRNARTLEWTRHDALASPRDFLRILDKLASETGRQGS